MKVLRNNHVESHLVALSLAFLLFIPTARVAFGLPGMAYVIPFGMLSALSVLKLLEMRVPRPASSIWFVFVSITLLAWLMATATWTISPEQFYEDLSLIAALIFIVASAFILSSPDSIRWTMVYTVAAAVITTLWIIAQYVGTGSLSGYNLVLSDSYLTIAQLVGIGAVGAVVSALVEGKWRAFWAIGGILSLLGLSLALARGALLSTIGVIVLVTVYLGATAILREIERLRSGKMSRSMPSRILLLLAPVGLVVATIYSALQVERTAVMLRRFFSGNELIRGGRGEIWAKSWASISESPLVGYGLGGSGLSAGQSDGDHAHNLLLQVWLDGGFFAMLMLLALLILPFMIAFLRQRRYLHSGAFEWLPFLAAYSFMILEFSKSGNLYSARGLFLFGLLATLSLAFATGERIRR